MAHDPAGFIGIVIDQAAREFFSFRVEATDDLAPFEATLNCGNSHSQQALALLPEDPDRTLIQPYAAAHVIVSGQPLFPGGNGDFSGTQDRADNLSIGDSHQYILFEAMGDDGIRP